MFTFKPKKVFEKINKMDRKQAYTIGAIAVVLIVALIMLISAAMSGEDDSFAGMNAQGYDLAQMNFFTDAAEKELLASAYPDMRENQSSFLYSQEEKAQRQAEDAQAAQEEQAEESSSDFSDDNSSSTGNARRGYSGSGSGRSGGGRGNTEIGQLSSAGMATSSGSGISSTYGPKGEFHQFKGRENRGNERPVQLKTDDARRALAQFRSDSYAAARMKDNKMRNAGRALFGGDIRGSEAFGKDGSVDLSKLSEGGLTLDTDTPAVSHDLGNLEKKVADAAKKEKDKKNEEDKREWWEDMLIDLAKNAANTLVNAFMGAVGDTISGTIQANQASRMARKAEGRRLASMDYSDLSASDQQFFQKSFNEQGFDTSGWTDSQWQTAYNEMRGTKELAKTMKKAPTPRAVGSEAGMDQFQIGVANSANTRSEKQRQQHEKDLANIKAQADQKAAEIKAQTEKDKK